jgi:hypothetical protein
MSVTLSELDRALTELQHAIQLARPLARAMRIDLTEQARTAVQLEAAIDRAVAAIVDAQAVRS